MATITRGAVTLTAIDVLGWSMTRETRTVVHPIIGDPEPDVTTRAPGLRTGDVHVIVATHVQAKTIADALAVPGGAWTIDAELLTMRARVTGDISVTSHDEEGSPWHVTVGVHEVLP